MAVGGSVRRCGVDRAVVGGSCSSSDAGTMDSVGTDGSLSFFFKFNFCKNIIDNAVLGWNLEGTKIMN